MEKIHFQVRNFLVHFLMESGNLGCKLQQTVVIILLKKCIKTHTVKKADENDILHKKAVYRAPVCSSTWCKPRMGLIRFSNKSHQS